MSDYLNGDRDPEDQALHPKFLTSLHDLEVVEGDPLRIQVQYDHDHDLDHLITSYNLITT